MIYEIIGVTIVEDIIGLDPGTFENIMLDCGASRFERLSKEPLSITGSENGGLEFPDYYYCDNVPLFSEKAYSMISDKLQENIFLRDVFINSPDGKKVEKYKMVLPRMIECVDKKKSVLRPLIPGIPDSPMRAEKLVIDEDMLGDAAIFKISGISDDSIYIRDYIKDILDNGELRWIEFIPRGGE